MFLLQASNGEFSTGDWLQQGGLALAVVLLIIAITKLFAMYLKKDKELKEAIEQADKKKDDAIEKQQKHYEEVLKEKDKLVAETAKKFEDLSEKFREKTTDLALSNQRYTMEVNAAIQNLNTTFKTQFDSLTSTIVVAINEG